MTLSSYPKFPQVGDRKASDSGYGTVVIGFADDGNLILNTTALMDSTYGAPTILDIEEDHCSEGSDTTGCFYSAEAPSIMVCSHIGRNGLLGSRLTRTGGHM